MRKLICVVLATLLCTNEVSAFAFSSATNNWAKENEVNLNLLKSNLTKAGLAHLLYELDGCPKVELLELNDVKKEDLAAASYGVFKGYFHSDKKFMPNQRIDKQDLAYILYQRAGSPVVSGHELEQYEDVRRIDKEKQMAMLWAVKMGIVLPESELLLKPTARLKSDEAVSMVMKSEKSASITALKEDLNVLTSMRRPVGSAGEKMAAEYLVKRFTEMGYEVNVQSYKDSADKTGSNVIAKKTTNHENADILILSAHHDSAPTAFGANDNASGVVALLAIAENLKNISTDTEIRLISFTDEENGKNGSRAYVNSLSEDEKKRIIGDIQLDMLGGYGSSGLTLSTTDGEENWITDLLKEKDQLDVYPETASDHTSFQLAGIPSVLVMQKGRGYLYHSVADIGDAIDLYSLNRAVTSVSAAVETIASKTTPSYLEIAHAQGESYAYHQIRQNTIYFSSSLKDSENYIGAAGELVDHHEIKGNGWSDNYDTYRYAMHWFNSDKPLNTYYVYRNGFLQNIEIKPKENGYSVDEIRAMIRAMLGEPTNVKEDEKGKTEGWTDVIYSKHITLIENSEDFKVTVSNFNVGISNQLASYSVKNGEARIKDEKHLAVWNYLCSVLPVSQRQKISEFNLYTDGYSNILAYTSPIRKDGIADNTQFSINLDYYDVYDENGVPRDWSKVTYTIIHEYGHVLLEDETQIDLNISKDTHDPAGFIEGSFRKKFYDAYWKDMVTGVNDYELHPDHYVSRYGANYFHEDIADTFAVFVLGDKPSGNSVAEQKLNLFYSDVRMMEIRSAIRENLGL